MTPSQGAQPNQVANTPAGGTAAPAGGSSAGSAGMKATSTPVSNSGGAAGAKAAAGSGGSMPMSNAMAGSSAGASAAAGAGGMAALSGGSSGSATAGAGGVMAMPGGADFPKDEPVNTDRMGPHMFDKYTMGLNSPTYASAIVYYPTDATPPFASIVFSPGFTATKEDYENFLGPLFASHGVVVLLTTPTSTSDQPPARADDLEAAMKQIDAENMRDGSPLKGKLATDRKCISGQSMGGGGTCIAANRLGTSIKCALPYEPWEPGMTFPKIQAPVMFIAAQSDTIAGVAQNAKPFYMSVPDSVPKYYVEFAGASHYLTTGDEGTNYDVQSKYIISFFKAYAEDDMRYLDVLNAPMDKELSDYQKSK
jgi:hypothetical protein